MARLIFMPIADEVKSSTYLVYDGACGTGGMLTVAEETLTRLADEHGKRVSVYLYGQEVNSETYAISKADLILKGEGEDAENIKFGSTLSADAFPTLDFDFMLSNPPYGKSWKGDLERMGGKSGMTDPALPAGAGRRRGAPARHPFERWADDVPSQHAQQDEAKHAARQPHSGSPQRQLAVHGRRRAGRKRNPTLDNRKRLAGSHSRAAARYVLQHRHRHIHLGTVQPQARASARIRAANRRIPSSFGRCERTSARRIASLRTKTSAACATRSWRSRKTERSKIFPNEAFGYWKVIVERPLRLEGDRPRTRPQRA